MEDFDYDELDKNVSSLGNSPAGGATRTDRPIPSLAGRRREAPKRFMDVVNPSSSVKPIATRPEKAPAPVATTVSTSPVAPTSPRVLSTPPEPAKPLQSSQQDSDLERLKQNLDQTLGVGDEKPVTESPFLPDAKVEKRPLGAFSVDDNNNTKDTQKTSANETTSDLVKDESNENDFPHELKAPLPEELHDDLLTIEANNVATGGDADTSAQSLDTVMPEKPAEKTSDSETSETSEVPDSPKSDTTYAPEVTPSTEASSVETMSISQQYSEQPSSDKSETAPIYGEASAQGKAMLNASPKKKNKVSTIVWMIVLVVAAVCAGILAYFVILPNL